MQRNPKIYLNDIKDAIGRIGRYTKDLSFGDFSSDEIVQDAVLRNLMVIGEAAKNIPKDIAENSKDVE